MYIIITLSDSRIVLSNRYRKKDEITKIHYYLLLNFHILDINNEHSI